MKYSCSFIVLMIQHLTEIRYKVTITAYFKQLQFLNAYNPEPGLLNYYSFTPPTCKTNQNEKTD